MQTLDRIAWDPGKLDGQCSIRGHITVSAIIREIADGHTIEDVLRAHPSLDREDVMQALRYNAVQLSHWLN